MTLATNLPSSMRKALRILCRTHDTHLVPPYARDTVFLCLAILDSFFGRAYTIPLSLFLQSPQDAVDPGFFG